MVDNKQQWKAWLYLAPAIILLLVFTAWPVINTLYMAFSENYGALSGHQFEKVQAIEMVSDGESGFDITVRKDSTVEIVVSSSSSEVSAVVSLTGGDLEDAEVVELSSEKQTLKYELTKGNYAFRAQKGDANIKVYSAKFVEKTSDGGEDVKEFRAEDLAVGSNNNMIPDSVGITGKSITTKGIATYVIVPTGLFGTGMGIGNFINVIQFKDFGQCMFNTIILCVLTVPISTLLALLIAVALNSIKGLQKFLQTIFFLPYVTNSIAIGMVFAAMFTVIGQQKAGNLGSVGIINDIIRFIIGDSDFYINWIGEGSGYWYNIAVLVIYIVWNALPFKILVLLGGLQAINTQYYDAAKVDGTSRSRVFTRITVPLLSPMLAYVIITGFIGGFKEYTSIVGIFGETMKAPAGTSLNTLVGMIYADLGTNAEGRASAAALILFVIILIVTQLNMKFGKKSIHY